MGYILIDIVSPNNIKVHFFLMGFTFGTEWIHLPFYRLIGILMQIFGTRGFASEAQSSIEAARV